MSFSFLWFFNHFGISSAIFLVADYKIGEVEKLGMVFEHSFSCNVESILLPRRKGMVIYTPL